MAAAAALAVAHGAAAGPIAGSLSAYRLLALGGGPSKWGEATPGRGAVVTFAAVTSAGNFPGAINCTSVVPIDDTLAENGISQAQFDIERDAAFHAWSSAANIIFIPGDAETADILIGAEGKPRGRAFTNVSVPDPGGKGMKSIKQSVICLNPDERWKIGFDGDLSVYDLRYTLMHEIGHAIGLDHPGARGEVMDFRYGEDFRSLQPGDIAGARALYGDPTITVGVAEPMMTRPRPPN